MDNAGYTALTRQAGLLHEMRAVANNIANISTTGFRREGVVFAEHVRALGPGQPSLSMANASVATTDRTQGSVAQTGGNYDFAIEGEGYFMVQTEAGNRLTRAGSFTPGPSGRLLTPDGHALLDAGQSPVVVPPGVAGVSLAPDGTLSADGQPLARIGVFLPPEGTALPREGGVLFDAAENAEVAEEARVSQGFLEGSNVNPVTEIARMIEVQRAYELGQHLLDREDERIRSVLQTLGR